MLPSGAQELAEVGTMPDGTFICARPADRHAQRPALSERHRRRASVADDRRYRACLEILFSTRTDVEYRRLATRLTALPTTPGGHRVWRRALQVQSLLAEQGGLHHRSVKIPDLVVAASAEAAGDIVLHYDEDFDRIAAVTGQPTEWVVLRGRA